MPQILVRNLSEETVSALKEKAKSQGRSLQEEVKKILEDQALINHAKFWASADLIRTRLENSGKTFSDSAELIREERDK